MATAHGMLYRQVVHRLIIATMGMLGLYGETSCQTVSIDQLGYRPNDPKMAFVQQAVAGKFEIKNIVTNRTVFSSRAGAIGRQDASSGDGTFILDFTPLKTPGTYRIWVADAELTSPEFRIDQNVYSVAAQTSLQSFYYQRCGSAVNNGTIWQHPPCHTDAAAFIDNPSATKDVSGGWHDAGDYNKFVPTTAVSAAFLLYLYESQSGKFPDGQLAIPESHNGIPDILDEARWALQWLLKLQREDGAVYHKVSIKTWTGEHLPDKETDRQYIFDVSSTSTADVAAVAALGARLFKKVDPQFALLLLKCASNAWKFLERHREIVPPGGFRNPPDVEGGEYGDQNDLDERLWASVELYRVTGNPEYHDFFLNNYGRRGGFQHTVSWQEVQNFAYDSYLHIHEAAPKQAVRAELLSQLERYCQGLLERIHASGYRYVLQPDEYYWGSNSIAMGYAFDLIQGYELTQRAGYLEAALDQLHYMLGRNPFDLALVTGVGPKPVRHPYHQFSMLLGAGEPVPGMVVGGANKSSKLRGKTLSDFPARCYEDNEKNYFVNETAINYTAPFVFVAGYFSQALKAQHDTVTTDGNR